MKRNNGMLNVEFMSISLMKFSVPVHTNVENMFDNYSETKFCEHFWLSKTSVKWLIITKIQLHQCLQNSCYFI